MSKIDVTKKLIPDENANSNVHGFHSSNLKEVPSTPRITGKGALSFATPRTQLTGAKKTAFKTPLTAAAASSKPTPFLTPSLRLQPKRLDFDCFEEDDVSFDDGKIENKVKSSPIPEEDDNMENWPPESGDTRPFEYEAFDVDMKHYLESMNHLEKLEEDEVYTNRGQYWEADKDEEALWEKLADNFIERGLISMDD